MPVFTNGQVQKTLSCVLTVNSREFPLRKNLYDRLGLGMSG